MARPPAYDRRTFAPAGPRQLRCLLCGVRVSSNALARAAHERSAPHRQREGLRTLREQQRST